MSNEARYDVYTCALWNTIRWYYVFFIRLYNVEEAVLNCYQHSCDWLYAMILVLGDYGRQWLSRYQNKLHDHCPMHVSRCLNHYYVFYSFSSFQRSACFPYVIPSAIFTRYFINDVVFSSVGGLCFTEGILVLGFSKVYCRLLYYVSSGFLTGVLWFLWYMAVWHIRRRVLRVQSAQRMFSLTLRSGLGVAFSVWVLITLEIIVFGYTFDTRAVLTCCNSFNLPSSNPKPKTQTEKATPSPEELVRTFFELIEPSEPCADMPHCHISKESQNPCQEPWGNMI